MKEVPRSTLAATTETPNIEEDIRKRAYELFEARVEKTTMSLKTGFGQKRKSGALGRMQ